jgi:hypothetical protein
MRNLAERAQRSAQRAVSNSVTTLLLTFTSTRLLAASLVCQTMSLSYCLLCARTSTSSGSGRTAPLLPVPGFAMLCYALPWNDPQRVSSSSSPAIPCSSIPISIMRVCSAAMARTASSYES